MNSFNNLRKRELRVIIYVITTGSLSDDSETPPDRFLNTWENGALPFDGKPRFGVFLGDGEPGTFRLEVII